MEIFTKALRLLLVVCFMATFQNTFAQAGILNPADPTVRYDPNNPPTEPAYGTMKKWVSTKRMSWATDSFKAYIYKGLAFRLRFPKTYKHNVADGKKYPVYVFFHGQGELGTIYDNEYQLYHGGDVHNAAVQNGTFDGFLLYPQNMYTGWSADQFDVVNEIIFNYMVPQVKADPYHVLINGLSAGGAATWNYFNRSPKTFAAALPISWSADGAKTNLQIYKYTPIWQFQGGLDNSPTPGYSQSAAQDIINAGVNYKFTLYPTMGHSCWDSAWREPDYFPFMNRAYKSNPWVLFGRTEFCTTDSINLTVGVTPGFTAYEWRKNGVLISGATGNSITVKSVGTYDCRIKNSSLPTALQWSDWSPIPLVIKYKTPTITPDIQLTAGSSAVLPVIDGSAGVKLQVPTGYVSYQWQKDGNDSVIGSENTFVATTPGYYKVKVNELYGCSSSFSNLFNVVDGNGIGKPDAPTAITATALSKTAIQLAWTQNPAPAYNETGFEVYQSTTIAGTYTLNGIAGVDATGFTANGLNSGSPYYFKIRAIAANGASSVAGPVTATTIKDTTAPSSPSLSTSFVTSNRVALVWSPSTDDVGVTEYGVYVNGKKSYVTTDTTYVVDGLTAGVTYNFIVKAKDFAGNLTASNQVSAKTIQRGLSYRYYTGNWTAVPYFPSLNAIESGVTNNVKINLNPETEYFGYLFEGYIKITTAGTYTFRVAANDGAKLYLNQSYTSTTNPFINNDGTRSSVRNVDANITLAAGVYPITLSYFQQIGGTATCNLLWKRPGSSSLSAIPDSVFTDGVAPATGPTAPSGLSATATAFNKIGLHWTDNSNNESGFEIYRSNSLNGAYNLVGTAAANAVSYSDSGLNASSKYYYKIRSIGASGESAFNDQGTSVNYAYYTGTFSTLPNFATLTPAKTGTVSTFDISVATSTTNFALKYDGTITVPTDGTYTFYTNSDEGSKLYIDGTDEGSLVVNNDGIHNATEKSGTKTLTAGAHSIRVTYFQRTGSRSLTVSYAGPGISKQAIPAAALLLPIVYATTPAAPGAPAIPTALTASAVGSSGMSIGWTHDGVNTTGYELYRSKDNNSQYSRIAIIPVSLKSYQDSGLVSNITYYYQVRAFNAGSFSGYSTETSAVSGNNRPVIADITNKSMRFDGQLSLNIAATDVDNEGLSFSFLNLPAFGSFTGTGNGTGTLTFTPDASSNGVTYSGISVIVQDSHGGSDTTTFDLLVNDNYLPVMGSISNVNVNEKATATINISATDGNSDALSWSFTGLPSFVSSTVNGDGSVTLQAMPGYADDGTYPITATVSDGRGGTDSKQFTLTVNDMPLPKTSVFINFNNVWWNAYNTAPWNNTSSAPSAGFTGGPYTDDQGNTPSVGLKVLSNWEAINNGDPTGDFGYVSGDNSGIYPDPVIKSGWYTTSGIPQSLQVTGLTPGGKYNVSVLGSIGVNGLSASSVYSIGAQNLTQDNTNNKSNVSVFSGVQAAADSTLTLGISAGPSSAYGLINALVVSKDFNDSTAPAAPKDFALALNNNYPALSWRDVAYNEDSYEVYRSEDSTTGFVLLNGGANSANTTQYYDTASSVLSNHTYYYKVRAVNAYGASAYTVALAATPANRAPVITAIANQVMRMSDSLTLNIVATDEPGNTVTLTASNLPSFAVFAQTGNGTGTLKFKPNNSYNGTYSGITITATDNYGAGSSQSFTLKVVERILTNVYVNFNDGTASQPAQPAPWNNMNTGPWAGWGIANMQDENGNNSGITLQLVDQWSGAANVGAVTGNNSGVYPDNVMNSLYFIADTATRRIKITGLSATKKYNFVFFAGRSISATASDNMLTKYTIGAQSVTLSASLNTTQTAQLTRVTADATGAVQINVKKDAGAQYGYLNALVIQSYDADSVLVAPQNLVASGISKTQIKLTWQDGDGLDGKTGYEIWKATTSAGVYSKLATVASNVTTYTDGGLSSGVTLFYKVRSVKNTNSSAYTAIAGASTILYNINIDYNDAAATPQSGAWNNTSSLPDVGVKVNNLINDQMALTGIKLEITKGFGGANNVLGAVTGNNSGIYPDNVMKTMYYLDYGDSAKLRFSGLNLSMMYNFVFFASTTYNPATSTLYIINGRAVGFNAWQNTTNTVTLSNIVPDATGTVNVTIYAADGYGYLNAMTVQALPNPNPPAFRKAVTAGLANSTSLLNLSSRAATTETAVTAAAYPNPFVDDVMLRLHLEQKASVVNVVVTDAKGTALMNRKFTDVPQGNWQQKLGLKGQLLPAGAYYIRVTGLPGENQPTVIKIMK